MDAIKLVETVRRCRYCKRDMTDLVSAQSYLENPFCRYCVNERLQKANDAMEPTVWLREGNYVTLVPLTGTSLANTT